MPLTIWAQIIIMIVVSVISYMLMPKPKTGSGDQSQDLRKPVAEAGIPVSVAFGDVTVLEPNTLWIGDIRKRKYKT